MSPYGTRERTAGPEGIVAQDAHPRHARPSLAPPTEDFARLADPFRAELLAHCYGMLGSLQDAEDQVQETYLRAWRAYADFEGRSSLRTWLYRIATNVCLTALDGRRRLPVPSGLPDAERTDDDSTRWSAPATVRRDELDPESTDPAAVVASRDHRTGALALVWRHLSPQQRAVLVLRDVLGWHATEIADRLGTSGAAVHSMVRRARAQLAQVQADARDPGPHGRNERRLLEDYAAAFETGDIGALVNLVTEDVICDVPGNGGAVRGRDAIIKLFANCPAVGESRMVAVRVAGRPAFGIYRRDTDGRYRAHVVDVLSTSRSGLARIDVIEDRSLFTAFGLPKEHPGEMGVASA